MTELGHAPAETATPAPDHPPATEQRPGSGDSQRYPTGVSAADTDPGYYDGDIKAALAADTTPTRQQAARDDSPAQQTPGDTTAASRDAAASGHDPDIEAILHENDHLPEPRTRQEAARDAPAPATPATRHDTPSAGDQQPPSGPDPLTQTASKDRPVPTGTTDAHAADRASPEHAPAEPAGHDQRVDIVRIGPEERTLGDTTPTGIGLKPTGDQLREMEPEAASWREAFRNEIHRESDEITDAAEKWGDLGAQLFDRPPASTHTETPASQPDVPHHEHQGIEGGQLAIAGFALGLLGFEATRKIHDIIQKRKETRHDGH